MGLIYIPTDANLVETQLTSDLQMSRAFLNRLKMATKHLTTVVGGGKLDGKAYRKGLGLMQDCVLPTIKHATSAIDGITQDLAAFTSAKSYMPNEPLYEDKLVAQIAELNVQKSAQEALSAVYQHHILSLVAGPIGVAIDLAISQFTDAKQQLDNWGNSVDEEIRKTQEKLDKLRQFNAQTTHLFQDSLSKLKLAMQGVAALNGSRINSDGSYRLAENKKSPVVLKKIGKLAKGVSSGTIITITVSGITYKLKASDLAKLKDITAKQKAGKFTYRGVSYFSKKGIKLKDFRGGKKSSFQTIRNLSKKLDKPLDKLQNTKALKKVTAKIPSYKHSTISRDLSNSKAVKSINKITGAGQTFKEAGKVARSFKIAGWVGTAVSVGSDYSELRTKGYSNAESTALTATHTAVSVAGASAGRAAGVYVGAIIGSIVPGAGTAVGAVVGGIIGSGLGGMFASKLNKQIDKSVKHNKKGLFGWGW